MAIFLSFLLDPAIVQKFASYAHLLGDCPHAHESIFFVYSLYVELVQKRNRYFKPHDTMALLLHGISSSMVTYALPPPLH